MVFFMFGFFRLFGCFFLLPTLVCLGFIPLQRWWIYGTLPINLQNTTENIFIITNTFITIFLNKDIFFELITVEIYILQF